jgi:threonine/homoserine/homoserine lactone efflux protein
MAVLLEAIGAALPAALAIALSPFPIVGIVLILAGPRGRSNGPLFAIGWLACLTLVTALVMVVFGGADDPDSTPSAIASWGRLLAGAALVALGVHKWTTRPAHGEAAATPRWMASLDTATPSRALALGALLCGANPKIFVLAAAAATSMAEVGLEGTELFVAVGLFVLIASVTVIGAVVVRLFGGPRGASMLDGVREFMVANNAVITMVILLLLGAKIFGDGLAGIAR